MSPSSFILGLIWSLFMAIIRPIYSWIWCRWFFFNYEKRVAIHKEYLFADLEEFKDSFEPYPITPVVQQTSRKHMRQGGAGGATNQQQQEDDEVKFNILEIDVGWGANFRYYPVGSSVIAVESTFLNERFQEYLEMIHDHSLGVKIGKVVLTDPENLGQVDGESVEVVVCTRVLSKVRDVDAVLAEIRRVLKPVGFA